MLGPALETERKDLNAAVKEYLVASGYKVTAMTFVEEVPSTAVSDTDSLYILYVSFCLMDGSTTYLGRSMIKILTSGTVKLHKCQTHSGNITVFFYPQALIKLRYLCWTGRYDNRSHVPVLMVV